jgi:hypothetical protein
LVKVPGASDCAPRPAILTYLFRHQAEEQEQLVTIDVLALLQDACRIVRFARIIDYDCRCCRPATAVMKDKIHALLCRAEDQQGQK